MKIQNLFVWFVCSLMACAFIVFSMGIFDLFKKSKRPKQQFSRSQKVVDDEIGTVWKVRHCVRYDDVSENWIYSCERFDESRESFREFREDMLDRLMLPMPEISLYAAVKHKETGKTGDVMCRMQGFDKWHYKILWDRIPGEAYRYSECKADELLVLPVFRRPAKAKKPSIKYDKKPRKKDLKLSPSGDGESYYLKKFREKLEEKSSDQSSTFRLKPFYATSVNGLSVRVDDNSFSYQDPNGRLVIRQNVPVYRFNPEAYRITRRDFPSAQYEALIEARVRDSVRKQFSTMTVEELFGIKPAKTLRDKDVHLNARSIFLPSR